MALAGVCLAMALVCGFVGLWQPAAAVMAVGWLVAGGLVWLVAQ